MKWCRWNESNIGLQDIFLHYGILNSSASVPVHYLKFMPLFIGSEDALTPECKYVVWSQSLKNVSHQLLLLRPCMLLLTWHEFNFWFCEFYFLFECRYHPIRVHNFHQTVSKNSIVCLILLCHWRNRFPTILPLLNQYYKNRYITVF